MNSELIVLIQEKDAQILCTGIITAGVKIKR